MVVENGEQVSSEDTNPVDCGDMSYGFCNAKWTLKSEDYGEYENYVVVSSDSQEVESEHLSLYAKKIFWDKFRNPTSTNLDLNQKVKSLVIANDYGKVEFILNNEIDLTDADLDSNIDIQNGSISVNSENLQQLNVSAIITLCNIETDNPKILVGEDNCPDCKINSFKDGTLVFFVPHFTTYSVVNDESLCISSLS